MKMKKECKNEVKDGKVNDAVMSEEKKVDHP